MVPEKKFKWFNFCDHCYSSSQDKAPVREHYHGREEHVRNVGYFGGQKTARMERKMCRAAFTEDDFSTFPATCCQNLLLFADVWCSLVMVKCHENGDLKF